IIETGWMRFNVSFHVEAQRKNEQTGVLRDSASDDDWPNESRLRRRRGRREMFGREAKTQISDQHGCHDADRSEKRWPRPLREQNDQPNEEKNQPHFLAQCACEKTQTGPKSKNGSMHPARALHPQGQKEREKTKRRGH